MTKILHLAAKWLFLFFAGLFVLSLIVAFVGLGWQVWSYVIFGGPPPAGGEWLGRTGMCALASFFSALIVAVVGGAMTPKSSTEDGTK